MSGNGGLTRGELARRAGIGIETIRYYERRGLLPAAPRSPAGYRRYGEDALARLRFVRRAKRLGFSLREIRDLLSLQVRRPADCAGVERRAARKLAQVRAMIADLERIAVALDGLVRACRANAGNAGCPLLDALEEDQDDASHRTGVRS